MDVERELVVEGLSVDEVSTVVLVEVESPSVLEVTLDEVTVVPVELVVEAVELVACVSVTKVSADATIRIATITSGATNLIEGGALFVMLDRLIEMTATIDKIQAMKMSPSASGTV